MVFSISSAFDLCVYPLMQSFFTCIGFVDSIKFLLNGKSATAGESMENMFILWVLLDCKSNEGNGGTVTGCISGLQCPQVAGQASSVRVVTNEDGFGIEEFFQDGVQNNFTVDAHCALDLFRRRFLEFSPW